MKTLKVPLRDFYYIDVVDTDWHVARFVGWHFTRFCCIIRHFINFVQMSAHPIPYGYHLENELCDVPVIRSESLHAFVKLKKRNGKLMMKSPSLFSSSLVRHLPTLKKKKKSYLFSANFGFFVAIDECLQTSHRIGTGQGSYDVAFFVTAFVRFAVTTRLSTIPWLLFLSSLTSFLIIIAVVVVVVLIIVLFVISRLKFKKNT